MSIEDDAKLAAHRLNSRPADLSPFSLINEGKEKGYKSAAPPTKLWRRMVTSQLLRQKCEAFLERIGKRSFPMNHQLSYGGVWLNNSIG